MNSASDLTIVIPAKNERKLLPRLLTSVASQDYAMMSNTKIFLADAGSTDGTPEVALQFRDRLQITIIPGGLPSCGRNAGAALAETQFVLFIDADVELISKALVRRCIELAQRKQLHCLTTNIICFDGNWLDKIIYLGSNLMQYLSRLHRPFSTGMFMLFEKKRFDELSGFDERAHFAEDSLLSGQVARNKFRVIRGGVYTTNRRLRKMGRFRVIKLFFTGDHYDQKLHKEYWQL